LKRVDGDKKLRTGRERKQTITAQLRSLRTQSIRMARHLKNVGRESKVKGKELVKMGSGFAEEF
jgi:hypothetical protein